MKNIKQKNKKIKKLMISMGITALLSTLAVAGILLYYGQINTTVNVSNILEIDGNPAENLIISQELNMYPGETNITTYTFMSYIDTNISFSIESPFIATTINYMGYPITYLDMTANTLYSVNISCYTPFNLTSGSYCSNITIIPTP